MNELIEASVAHFRTLLSEQIARQERMEKSSGAKDFRTLDKITIGLVPGDGIGPIISSGARKILEVLLKDEISSGKIELRLIEGLTLENRIEKKVSVPDDVLASIRECDVLLKGPTTTPHGGWLESANVVLRRELDLYSNVRPVRVPEKGIDWTFFRENTEGEYALGSKGIEIPGKLAMDFKVTTDAGTRRIARAAFEYAKNNGKTRVSIVTKANIMKKTDGSFSAVCHEIAEEYPGIIADDFYIDIMCANLINESMQKGFQVFLLPNLYGDIITDEAAQIQGGVGTAGSANTGDEYAMFEPIHGSAPRLIEEGLGEYASPESILTAAVMMLRHIALPDKAAQLENAMQSVTCRANGTREGATCAEYCDEVMQAL